MSEAEGVRVSIESDRISVTNESAEPVRIAAIETDYFEHALALWCIGGECGARVARGQTGSIKLDDVSGYRSDSREVTLFWWYDRPNASDEEKVSNVRRVAVPL